MQGRLEFQGHQDQWDQQAPKGQRGSLVSPVQPCPDFPMGTAMWFTCRAQLERRESPVPQALDYLGSRAEPESVDSRARRVMLEIRETPERQAPLGSLECLESLEFGVLLGQKEKRAMAALPALACRGR